MTTYVVLLTGDEAACEHMSAEERAGVFAKHEEFARLLTERGHELVGGEELTPSTATKTIVSSGTGAAVVSDGPYAETVERLGAFYLVKSDDMDDLLEICRVLVSADGAVEGAGLAGRMKPWWSISTCRSSGSTSSARSYDDPSRLQSTRSAVGAPTGRSARSGPRPGGGPPRARRRAGARSNSWACTQIRRASA